MKHAPCLLDIGVFRFGVLAAQFMSNEAGSFLISKKLMFVAMVFIVVTAGCVAGLTCAAPVLVLVWSPNRSYVVGARSLQIVRRSSTDGKSITPSAKSV